MVYINEVERAKERALSDFTEALPLAHLGQKPGDLLFNSLTSGTRNLGRFLPFRYPFDCLRKSLSIKL